MAISQVAAYAHLSEADIEALGRELDAIRANIEDSLGARDAAYIRRTIRFQRMLDIAARLVIGCSRTTDGLAAGHDRPRRREEHREHGDRPQCRSRAMGLDERPGNPLQHVGMGHGGCSRPNGAIRTTTRTTCTPTSLGMDDDMGFGIMRITRDETVEARLPGPATAKPLAGSDIRMGHRPARLALGARPRADDSQKSAESQGAGGQGRTPSREGLCAISRTEWTAMAADADGQRNRQSHQKPVGLCRDLLRPFPRRRREIRPRCTQKRDQSRMVSAADARHRELRRRTRSGVSSAAICAIRSSTTCSPTYPAIA